MDNIRFYQRPPTFKKREQPTSTGSTSASTPVFEISGPSGTGSGHVQEDQAVSRGRFQQPTASSVTAIELPVEEETGASALTSGTAKNEMASAVGQPVSEDSPLDPSRPRNPGVRYASDIMGSTETTQIPFDQNAAASVYFAEQNDQSFDIERQTQSMDTFFNIQNDSCRTHISTADAQAQPAHPGSWQIPPWSDDHSSASPEIYSDLRTGAIDQQDESRITYEPIFDNARMTVPASGLVLEAESLDEGPDPASRGAAQSRGQSPDSTSDGSGSVIAQDPRISMDVQAQADEVLSISCDNMSRSQPTGAPSPPGIDLRDQDSDRCPRQAAMPLPSLTLSNRTTDHDLTIYPLEPTDSYLLTAFASGLQELEQLCACPDAWTGPQTAQLSDRFTVLGIKPLGDERWLLLAKISHPTYPGSRPSGDGEEAVRSQMDTGRKREIVANKGTLVNTHNRGRTVNSANGRLSRQKRGNWKESEDQRLTSMVESGVPWSVIVARFPRRTEAAVRSRWNCVLKPLVP